MAEVKVLDKNSVKNGDEVVVTKTTEEHLTRQDLLQAKQNLLHRRQGLIQQSEQLNKQLLQSDEQDKEIDDLIKMLE
jgi:hypothetical protein